jgi:23S rRNA (cytosine1962-C5)-methyltransferase
MTAAPARLVLRKNQDRRVRGGHPWVFSNELAEVQGAPADGDLVEVVDFRGAFLGRAYYNRRSLICARLITRGRDEVDEAFFVRRIERALKLRETIDPGAAAARLVYGESDQLPGLVVDRYGDWLAVQVLTLGMEVRAELVRAALERVLKPRGVMRIADSALRALEGLPLERGVWWGEVPDRIEVTLDGLELEVDLHRGQKTGLYLDQRDNRRRAAPRARGARVLDLFCYQGEWGLHAIRGGATEVLAVDSSARALELARRNADRNGLGDRITFRQGDCFEVVRELERKGERFGMVILDPPALIKSRNSLAAGARAYRDINRAAMGLLAEGGTLVSCSCSHHLDDPLFKQVLIEAARAARRPFRVLDWTAEAPDHPQLLAVPETHYLKCATLQAI